MVVEETETFPPASYLDEHKSDLEGMIFCTVNLVLGGDGPFEAYKPRIMRGLERVKWSGGIEWYNSCSERISQVEADLQALQDLERIDVNREIAQALAQIERAPELGTPYTNSLEKERLIDAAQEKYNQTQIDLTNAESATAATQRLIIDLEAELAQKRSQLI